MPELRWLAAAPSVCPLIDPAGTQSALPDPDREPMMVDRRAAENQELVPSCRVSRVMAKPGTSAVTLKDLHERLSSIRGLPTLWEGLQRLFHLQRDELVVMPLSLLRECEREAGPAPACIRGIVGLRDVFILHHRSERPGPPVLLPEPVMRHIAPACCDGCGAQSLSHFYSSRDQRRTLCPSCFQTRIAPMAPLPDRPHSPVAVPEVTHGEQAPGPLER